jgi:hypothetical protein
MTNNKEFILLRNKKEEMGTIACVSSILRVFSQYDTNDDANFPFKITVQYKLALGTSQPRTKLSFETEAERNKVFNLLIETLDPIIFDDKTDLDSIM